MSETYAYRREDDHRVEWVDFEHGPLAQDRAGFITLADGVQAKRCHGMEDRELKPTSKAPPSAVGAPVVSDSLGFPEQCLEGRQRQLQELGCKGIEFKRDPKCPEFIQVHGASRAALDRYTRKRGMVNRTGSLGGGVLLSQEDLDRAAELVGRDKAIFWSRRVSGVV